MLFRSKVRSVAARGAEVVLHGDTYDEACAEARRLERERHLSFIHPFDDPEVIAGQGTIALEILRQCSEPPDAIYVAVGGGGLIAGIAAYALTRGGSDGGGATTATQPTDTAAALVEIPDVVGQSVDDATAALKAVGLAVLVTKQASNDAPAGQVLGMRPNAGGKVPEGTTVELQVSAGPTTVTVPSVEGSALGDAKAQIEALGLVVEVVEDASDSVAEGNVIITQDKLDASGKKAQRYTAMAKRAVFDNAAGTLKLYGWPEISESLGDHITKQTIAREEGTVITLDRAGKLLVNGYSTSRLLDASDLNQPQRTAPR